MTLHKMPNKICYDPIRCHHFHQQRITYREKNSKYSFCFPSFAFMLKNKTKKNLQNKQKEMPTLHNWIQGFYTPNPFCHKRGEERALHCMTLNFCIFSHSLMWFVNFKVNNAILQRQHCFNNKNIKKKKLWF